MTHEFSYDVFLSHSGKDKDIVRPLAERLRSDGLESLVRRLVAQHRRQYGIWRRTTVGEF